MVEEEVPDWIKFPYQKEEDDTKEYGKGNRIRKQVNYLDDFANPELVDIFENVILI